MRPFFIPCPFFVSVFALYQRILWSCIFRFPTYCKKNLSKRSFPPRNVTPSPGQSSTLKSSFSAAYVCLGTIREIQQQIQTRIRQALWNTNKCILLEKKYKKYLFQTSRFQNYIQHKYGEMIYKKRVKSKI